MFFFAVFIFTNSWTVGTSNTKKVLNESLLIYVLPLLTVQIILFFLTFWFKQQEMDNLATASLVVLLLIPFGPILFFMLVSLYGMVFRRKK